MSQHNYDTYLYDILNTAGINAGTAANTGFANTTGYVPGSQVPGTPQGQEWIQSLYDAYNSNYQAGTTGYGLPGSTGGDPNFLYDSIRQSSFDPGVDPALSAWIQSQGAAPNVPTLARDQMDKADSLARDLADAQIKATAWEGTENRKLQRDLQAGLISAQAAQQASQQVHEKFLQAQQMTFKYAELEWTEEYGNANLDILRDRLDWEVEFGQAQIADNTRRTDILQQGADLDTERFGLEKAIQEAMLKANPFNAVANALYTGGGQISGELDEFGAPTDTLRNSGTLPFLQDLSGGGIQDRGFTQSPLNQQGIGGNVAPNPNSISQQSLQNMSSTEQGITSSLAAFQGYNPQDYWNQVQKSFNTAGQSSINFGTRIV